MIWFCLLMVIITVAGIEGERYQDKLDRKRWERLNKEVDIILERRKS